MSKQYTEKERHLAKIYKIALWKVHNLITLPKNYIIEKEEEKRRNNHGKKV